MRAREALREAMRRVQARPRWLLAIAALELVVALAAAAPLSSGLQPLFDEHPAATRVVDGDDALAIELLMDHPEVTRAGGTAAQLATLGWGLFSWLLAGGLLTLLARGEFPSEGDDAAQLAAACVQRAGKMVKVGLCGLLVRGIPLAIAGGVAFLCKPLFVAHGFREVVLGTILVGSVLGLLWAWASIAIDAARAFALDEPLLGAFRAIGRGLRFAARRSGTTLALALVSALAFLIVTAGAHALSAALPSSAGAFLMVSLVRVAACLARVAITMTVLIATGLVARSAT